MFGSSVKYLLFLVWVGAVYFIGIGIFTSGFLLRRQVLSNWNCKQQLCAGQVLPNRTEPGDAQSRNQPPAVFQKAVILLIGATELLRSDKIKMMLTTANLRTIFLSDALKYDFCLHNDSLLNPKPYQVVHLLTPKIPNRHTLNLDDLS